MIFSQLYALHEVPGDQQATASAIIGALRLSRSQIEALGPLILDECVRLDRSRVRGIERTFDRVTRQHPHRRNGVPVDMTDINHLLVECFSLPGGRSVPWGTATIEEHMERIAMQRRHIEGCEVDIERHNEAIRIIQSVPGATCLNEARQTV